LVSSRTLVLGDNKAETAKRNFLRDLWNDDRGITSVEYALLLSFVASGLIVATDLLSGAAVNQIEAAANCINGDDATICM